MFYPVKILCYCVIISSMKLQFSACFSFTQEEYNIIASRPMKLVCNVETNITNTVTIRSPDTVVVVQCQPSSTLPPIAASCSSSGVYSGAIDETAKTVTVTTNILPGDVNGTWSCTHGTSFETIVFPSPIPCLISENFDVNPSSTGNVTSTTAIFSLIATYSCINVDVTFKWILKAGTSSQEFIPISVTKDSAACTDSGTCTGVSAYTQTISSDALFNFATAQSLIGGYELSAEAHYSDGVTALKSHSIGYFEFSGHASTQKPTTQPTPDQKCFLGIHYPPYVCVIIITAGIIVVVISVACIIYRCRKNSNKSTTSEHKPIYVASNLRNVHEESDEGIPTQNGTESNLNSNNEFTPEQKPISDESENEGDEGIPTQNGTDSNFKSNNEFTPEQKPIYHNSNLRNVPEENKNGGDEGISTQNGTESNLNRNNETKNSAHKSESSFHYQFQNERDKSECYENSNRGEDDTSNFDAVTKV